MRTIPSNLYADIQEGCICNIVKIQLLDGTVYGYTDHDEEITVGSVTYIPSAGLQKVRLTLTPNSEVSNQELASAWVDAPEEDLLAGKFDSATIIVSWVSWKNPSHGQLVIFSGKLGEITWSDVGFKADIFSNMKDLEQNIGEVFTANCRHTLYSQDTPGLIGFCGVNQASFTASGNVTAVVKNRWKFQINNTQSSGFYSGGKITFSTGQNAGLSFSVKNHEGQTVELFLPTSFPITVNDAFTISAGCDKTMETCKSKFNNIVNFGGFPHIQPDVSFR